jgi:hypothetical protein
VWPVSDRFLEALKGPHKYKALCTVTVPGGESVEVEIKGGTLTVDGSSRIRRRISNLELVGDSTVYEVVSTPGAIFAITQGIAYGSSDELVPIFWGEAQSPAQSFGDGSISVTLVDLGNWLARCRFLTPYAPAGGTTRVAAITAVVQGAIPTATVTNLSSDTGTITAGTVWSESRGDAITNLTQDGGTEAYFRADGSFVIRDIPTTATAPVWSASSGAGGVLKSATRTRPTDRLYNTYVVRPGDQAQTWAQQIAQVTDTANPRHPDHIGVVPYFYTAPTASTAAVALQIANNGLDRVLGTTESLALSSIANPALEAGDSIRVITPRINTEPAQIFQHFIDSYTMSLSSGDMQIATRSQIATDD